MYEHILKVANELLYVCDGAIKRDYQGYNKPDALVVRKILRRNKLTDDEMEYLRRILLKYQVQIQILGLNYQQLTVEVSTVATKPSFTDEEKAADKHLNALESAKIEKFENQYGPKFGISFPYDPQLVKQLKALDWEKTHRRWNPEEKRWELDANDYSVSKLVEIGFRLSGEGITGEGVASSVQPQILPHLQSIR